MSHEQLSEPFRALHVSEAQLVSLLRVQRRWKCAFASNIRKRLEDSKKFGLKALILIPSISIACTCGMLTIPLADDQGRLDPWAYTLFFALYMLCLWFFSELIWELSLDHVPPIQWRALMMFFSMCVFISGARLLMMRPELAREHICWVALFDALCLILWFIYPVRLMLVLTGRIRGYPVERMHTSEAVAHEPSLVEVLAPVQFKSYDTEDFDKFFEQTDAQTRVLTTSSPSGCNCTTHTILGTACSMSFFFASIGCFFSALQVFAEIWSTRIRNWDQHDQTIVVLSYTLACRAGTMFLVTLGSRVDKSMSAKHANVFATFGEFAGSMFHEVFFLNLLHEVSSSSTAFTMLLLKVLLFVGKSMVRMSERFLSFKGKAEVVAKKRLARQMSVLELDRDITDARDEVYHAKYLILWRGRQAYCVTVCCHFMADFISQLNFLLTSPVLRGSWNSHMFPHVDPLQVDQRLFDRNMHTVTLFLVFTILQMSGFGVVCRCYNISVIREVGCALRPSRPGHFGDFLKIFAFASLGGHILQDFFFYGLPVQKLNL